jgi:hypothetical protein
MKGLAEASERTSRTATEGIEARIRSLAFD